MLNLLYDEEVDFTITAPELVDGTGVHIFVLLNLLYKQINVWLNQIMSNVNSVCKCCWRVLS